MNCFVFLQDSDTYLILYESESLLLVKTNLSKEPFFFTHFLLNQHHTVKTTFFLPVFRDSMLVA